MEWIEVSARTLEDATELALDRLGVVADELEYEVIDEPRGGLFGIGRTEARIRARVKPLSREKPAERRRRRGSERRPSGGSRKPRADVSNTRAAAPRPVPGDGEAENLRAPRGRLTVDVVAFSQPTTRPQRRRWGRRDPE